MLSTVDLKKAGGVPTIDAALQNVDATHVYKEVKNDIVFREKDSHGKFRYLKKSLLLSAGEKRVNNKAPYSLNL